MTIVSEMSALVPWMQKRSAQLDAAATFPDEEIVALRQAGALNMPLPIEHHTHDASDGALADGLATFLMQMGAGDLAVGTYHRGAHQCPTPDRLLRFPAANSAGSGRSSDGASVCPVGH